jgi:hypothetical protein
MGIEQPEHGYTARFPTMAFFANTTRHWGNLRLQIKRFVTRGQLFAWRQQLHTPDWILLDVHLPDLKDVKNLVRLLEQIVHTGTHQLEESAG